MTETISINVDSEDKKNFEAAVGMKVGDYVKLLMNNLKYGGKLGLDPFFSEENIAELKRRIDDMKHGKNIVTFSDEEWEKFVDAQNIS